MLVYVDLISFGLSGTNGNNFVPLTDSDEVTVDESTPPIPRLVLHLLEKENSLFPKNKKYWVTRSAICQLQSDLLQSLR